jgi:hypothetical protein
MFLDLNTRLRKSICGCCGAGMVGKDTLWQSTGILVAPEGPIKAGTGSPYYYTAPEHVYHVKGAGLSDPFQIIMTRSYDGMATKPEIEERDIVLPDNIRRVFFHWYSGGVLGAQIPYGAAVRELARDPKAWCEVRLINDLFQRQYGRNVTIEGLYGKIKSVLLHSSLDSAVHSWLRSYARTTGSLGPLSIQDLQDIYSLDTLHINILLSSVVSDEDDERCDRYYKESFGSIPEVFHEQVGDNLNYTGRNGRLILQLRLFKEQPTSSVISVVQNAMSDEEYDKLIVGILEYMIQVAKT